MDRIITSKRLAWLALSLAIGTACSDLSHRFGDAGGYAMPDGGGQPIDAAVADAAPPLVAWSGGPELPALSWTLPDCTLLHGVVARNVLEPEPHLPLEVVAVAAREARMVLSWSEGWAAVDESGAQVMLPRPEDGFAIERSPLAVAVGEDRSLGLVFSGSDYRVLLSEVAEGLLTTSQLGAIAYDGGSLLLDTNLWQRNNGWIGLQEGADRSITIVGEWVRSGTSEADFRGLARVTLDAAREPVGRPEWYEPAAYSQFSQSPTPRVFVESAAASAVVFRWGYPDSEGDVEVVIHDAAGEMVASTLVEVPSQWNNNVASVTAAIDRDVLVVGWLSAIRDVGYAQELAAEISLTDGRILRDPETLWSPVGSGGILYLGHPGGGIDVIKYGSTAPGFVYDRLLRGNNPLSIYLEMQRPLAHAGATPLKLGAGATVWDALAVRDQERIVVFWREFGPATSEFASEARAVQGLYYAVLDCD